MREIISGVGRGLVLVLAVWVLSCVAGIGFVLFLGTVTHVARAVIP
jgi:hypothetical protein